MVGKSMSNKVLRKIKFWAWTLDLDHFTIRVELILELQVTGDDGSPGRELVGVEVDRERFVASIVTTRKLREDDIVHELVHVRNPEWHEEMVAHETESLLVSRDSNYFEARTVSKERI